MLDGPSQVAPGPAFCPGGAVLPLEMGENYLLGYAEFMVISVRPPQKYVLFLEKKKMLKQLASVCFLLPFKPIKYLSLNILSIQI